MEIKILVADIQTIFGCRQRQNPYPIPESTLTRNAGAVAAATFLKQMGLFHGQSEDFFETLDALAVAADKARRQVEGNDEEEA
jgi:hypothetical protein